MFCTAWQAARTLAEGQDWLLSAAQALACGLAPSEIASALRAGHIRSIYTGVYLLDPDLVRDLGWRQWHRAALLAHGVDACLVGWSAVRAAGGEGLPASDPTVDVAAPGLGARHRRRPTDALPIWRPVDAPSILVRQWPIVAGEIEMVDGLRMRSAPLSVVDAALLLDRAHALCLFDWALRAGVHTSESLGRVVASIRRRPGAVHVREMAALADGRAASPLESRVRLACIDGDVAPDELQYPVVNNVGVVMGYGDLAWVRRRRPLIGEADGRDVHSTTQALFHDRRRANNFLLQSCDIVRFTWADGLRPVYVQQVVRAALTTA